MGTGTTIQVSHSCQKLVAGVIPAPLLLGWNLSPFAFWLPFDCCRAAVVCLSVQVSVCLIYAQSQLTKCTVTVNRD